MRRTGTRTEHGNGGGVDAAPTRLGGKLATVVVGECLALVGADAGFVATVGETGETLEVARVTPYSERPAHLSFPVDAPYPLAYTVWTREPLLVASNEELCEHPGLVCVKSEDHACATMPLVADDGTLLGAVNFGFDEPHPFSDEEVAIIDAVARRCAEAMSAGRRLEADLRSRTNARPVDSEGMPPERSPVGSRPCPRRSWTGGRSPGRCATRLRAR